MHNKEMHIYTDRSNISTWFVGVSTLDDRVQVCRAGEWRGVCNNGFGHEEAQVVC